MELKSHVVRFHVGMHADSKARAQTAQQVQAESAAALAEIRHSLAYLRQLLVMRVQSDAITQRCVDTQPTCRERAPRIIPILGGAAMFLAGTATHSAALNITAPFVVAAGMVYCAVAPCTVGEGLHLLRLCFKRQIDAREEIVETTDMRSRIAGLEMVERILHPQGVADEVRRQARLPAEVAALVGEYVGVPAPSSSTSSASRPPAEPPGSQSMQ